MRTVLPPVLEAGRERSGPFASDPAWGPVGRFHLLCPETGRRLLAFASDGTYWAEAGLPGEPWEHVSVTLYGRTTCPAWPEMDWVKSLFWSEEEVVIQLHPPGSVKLNHHPGCLHLWRPKVTVIPLPPPVTVAYPKEDGHGD